MARRGRFSRAARAFTLTPPAKSSRMGGLPPSGRAASASASASHSTMAVSACPKSSREPAANSWSIM
eukprot:3842889-Pyramimonas_sp.AAC.1